MVGGHLITNRLQGAPAAPLQVGAAGGCGADVVTPGITFMATRLQANTTPCLDKLEF
jgi:hypothetical protein